MWFMQSESNIFPIITYQHFWSSWASYPEIVPLVDSDQPRRNLLSSSVISGTGLLLTRYRDYCMNLSSSFTLSSVCISGVWLVENARNFRPRGIMLPACWAFSGNSVLFLYRAPSSIRFLSTWSSAYFVHRAEDLNQLKRFLFLFEFDFQIKYLLSKPERKNGTRFFLRHATKRNNN